MKYVYFAGPAGIYSPIVTLLSPHTAKVEWEQPEVSNGPIIRYEVLFPEPRYTLEGNTNFSLTVEELIPFTEYQVNTDVSTYQNPENARYITRVVIFSKYEF